VTECSAPRDASRPGSPFLQGFAFGIGVLGVSTGKYWGEVAWWKLALIIVGLALLSGGLNVLRVRLLQRKHPRSNNGPTEADP
jgi:hypothetical protein